MIHHLYILFTFLVLSFTLNAQTYLPGETYLDDNQYVEYLAGNLPIIISAPHGGYLEPDEIPDRDCAGCVTVRDAFTQELSREMIEEIVEATGCYPHVIINLLHRKKFDANRDVGDAADGNAAVIESWMAYHDFINTAKEQVIQDYGRGLFLDMHGHGHEIQRIELGYTLSKSELQLTDDELNTNALISDNSIQALINNNLLNLSHSELLRGDLSFGTLLDERGFPAVPSAVDPFPQDSEAYFSGGYNTLRHGSENGGLIDGIQIECNQDIRFDESIRKAYADSLVQATLQFLDTHYFEDFNPAFCGILSAVDEPVEYDRLKILPNPAQDYIQLEFATPPIQVSIINQFGIEVAKMDWNNQPISIEALPIGIYYLSFRASSGLLGKGSILIKQ